VGGLMGVVEGMQALKSQGTSASADTEKMPPMFVYIIVGICVVPFILSMMGVDFGSYGRPVDLEAAKDWSGAQKLDAYFYRLTGAFTHTLLEWSAFAAAIFTVCLALCHFVIARDLTTPIIGAALFLAGCMDAFHTLAADRLIEAVAPNTDLIPFTWAICRIFNAIILIVGVVILLVRKPVSAKADIRFLITSCVIFAVTAYAIIHYCAVSASLPQTQYPDNIVTRPYDVVPLLLYAFAGLYLFPLFYKRHPSVFAHALVIAMIPECVVELHMAFGSSSLFDNHFNIAHFLKILAYIVPFCGLLIDYVHTYQAKEQEVVERKVVEENLRRYAAKLKDTNEELDKFAYIASHDLKAPLRGIEHLATWIEEDIDDKEATSKHLVMLQQRTKRMEKLLEDLLNYSRIGRSGMDHQLVDTKLLVEKLFDMASPPKGFELRIGHLPSFDTIAVPFELVLRNLITNAIKHHDKEAGLITVMTQDDGEFYDFTIQDDGPDIPKDLHEKAFEVFQTLQPRDDVEGSGIGLAMVKKTVETYGGEITLESDVGIGAKFHVHWPKIIKDG